LPQSKQDEGATNAGYRIALKTTSVTGLAQIVVLVLALVKSKAIAVLLGPAGIGLLGILTTVRTVASTVVGLGVSGSAVRQVAEAAASGDELRIARVVTTLRTCALWLGIIGAVGLFLAARPVSVASFGSLDYVTWIALLSAAVLLGSANEGQVALLRGLRRIRELAILNVLGAAFGTVAAVALVWRWGLAGVAPGIVAAAALSLAASWWYARRVAIVQTRFSTAEVAAELKGLLSLGLAFLVTGVLAAAVQFGQRALLSHRLGLEAVGEFQAAASLSVVYVGFILQAMSQDFFPRLTGLVRDPAAATRLVNEQIELSLLLAGPGMLLTVALAPWLITVLYSADFGVAADLLRWQCLGVLLRVASWPLGFVLVARGDGRVYLATEVTAHAVHMAAFYWLVKGYGLDGAALGLVACYAFYLPVVHFAARRAMRFKWSAAALRVQALLAVAYALCLVAVLGLPGLAGIAVAATIAVLFGIYAYRELARLTSVPLIRKAAAVLASTVRGIRGDHALHRS
jgi:PST family polysaccharide transporter